MLVWTSACCLGWPELSVEEVDINCGGNSVACEGRKKRYLNKKECLKTGGVQQRHSVGNTYGL